MKKLILILTMLAAALAAGAQCATKNEAIKAGERLTYKLKFNWKFVWVNAGEAYMNVDRTIYNGRPAIRTELLSTGNKKVDFFFKMRDTLISFVTPQLEPLYFKKAAEEGKHYTVDQVWYDYRDGRSRLHQQRSRDGRLTHQMDTTSTECLFDMLSILLQARSLDPADFAAGHKILFPMATGRRVEQQTLIFRGREKFKSQLGVKFRCLKFSLVEYNKKGKEVEVITFYITDDKNHLPVRLDLYLNIGSAKAFLINIEGNRHPLTSIVK